MRRIITILLIASALIVPASASTIHSLNFAYSVHDGSHLGLDYSASADSIVHAYGGIYGLLGLGGASPEATIGIYVGPGFSIPLNQERSLLLQLAIAVDIPRCFAKDIIGTGLGVLADVGLKWRFTGGLLSDGMYLSAGVKGGYYLGYVNLDFNDLGNIIGSSERLMQYRFTPYIGIGFAL